MENRQLMSVLIITTMAMMYTGTSSAALQERDLNSDGSIDALYDTERKLTWLRDSNINGKMNWFEAVAWAENLTFAGFDDWRLPETSGCPSINYCINSEMRSLWVTELGNPIGGPMTNEGSFLNVVSGNDEPHAAYWIGTEYIGNPTNMAHHFHTFNFATSIDYKVNLAYAMAVREGDISPVPEPNTYAILFLGLAAISFITLRRKSIGKLSL